MGAELKIKFVMVAHPTLEVEGRPTTDDDGWAQLLRSLSALYSGYGPCGPYHPDTLDYALAGKPLFVVDGKP